MWLDHHADVWSKCHASTCDPWRARGVRSMCYRSNDRSTIVTLEVAVPLMMALDGDVAILSQAAALEFGLKVSHSDAHCRCTCSRCRCMHYQQCASHSR
jgi:hypothetical protein